MWVRVLGSLDIRHEGELVTVHAAKQRALLAVLLLHANRAVSFDELAEILWDGSPGGGARTTVRNYVCRLRQVLGPAVADRIITQDPGYLFRVDDSELDLLRFRALYRDGAAATRRADWPLARRVLGDALVLWRGPALADVHCELLHRDHGPGLEQMRLQALEARIEADLHLGSHDEVTGELQSLAALYPLRERFHAQLMLALYRSGRQAEALAAFQRARNTLVAELGVEPGTELRRLHERILSTDSALDVVGPGCDVPPPATQRIVPRQLPATPTHFVGRREELEALSALLDQPSLASGTVVISAIAGMPGAGKTALAVHWAHAVADRFPDGQLYVNLRGYDPGARPVTASEAIHGFLTAMETPTASIPAGIEAQAALYRTRLAGQRMLVVLDNAADEQQVRPLLPGATGSVVLITSRAALDGLVAAEGASPVRLDVFHRDDALELLARRLGHERVAVEPAAVAELITLCARLPLALNIAAARATARPQASLATIAADLRQAGLDALDSGDPATSVRAVFSVSYRALGSAAARAFRLLSLSPGPDISLPAVASLLGVPGRQARQELSELSRAHLLSEPAPGRYSVHDLLRCYGAELAQLPDRSAERTAGLHRMFDHYLHTGFPAALLLRRSRPPITLAPCQPGVKPEALGGEAQALTWLKAECPALLAMIPLAADSGFETHAWQIAWTLTDFLFGEALLSPCVDAQQVAVAACARIGDLDGKARALVALANARDRLGEFEAAHGHLREALALFERLGDHSGQGRVHHDVGHVLWGQGRPAEALARVRRAVELFRTCGDRASEGVALNGMGWCHAHLGDYRQALAHCQQALGLHRELGHRADQAQALDSLGYAHHNLGEYTEALAYYGEALHLYTTTGDRVAETDTLTRLGETHFTLGDLDTAVAAWHQALEILDNLGHPNAGPVRERLADVQPVV
jgi:DNA-binding SARP family transcriptional activator/Tfp pilus assembly protein PilF